jgi:hypothetical protein
VTYGIKSHWHFKKGTGGFESLSKACKCWVAMSQPTFLPSTHNLHGNWFCHKGTWYAMQTWRGLSVSSGASQDRQPAKFTLEPVRCSSPPHERRLDLALKLFIPVSLMPLLSRNTGCATSSSGFSSGLVSKSLKPFP